jgi:hypothetical protein
MFVEWLGRQLPKRLKYEAFMFIVNAACDEMWEPERTTDPKEISLYDAIHRWELWERTK